MVISYVNNVEHFDIANIELKDGNIDIDALQDGTYAHLFSDSGEEVILKKKKNRV